ncbi:MAG: Asp-tRNA(Asn)/Glu-tRNA(Gln) amidotransferase GatCAB subunit C [Gemmatimonas sp.]|uniref:Asp-tRNA(Asn)/Glu-tRNA(Gln) amidotransferase subunit GatC n=1 Tax=Gemmatimonas sp. UBA7669 TaxID=1946568 RepID=UPI0025BC8E0E|nr:Asp-tRNA(Asn)/Glu-tRNA(Gln) amidotransferase subunit GatC [Gemmatimonas sp. UBA7669]MBA3918727.1 Asp-tRNA(Asn)/Glu-tRNA(Gln) amidotransferase GatCAB subunit C [Gemmatimonas sp.]
MSVTPEDVRHVARLARLGLDEAELPQLVSQLNGILEHMDVLQQVQVPDAVGDWQQAAQRVDVARRDDAQPSDSLAREREAFAPAMRDGFFLVPRLATHEALGASAEREA